MKAEYTVNESVPFSSFTCCVIVANYAIAFTLHHTGGRCSNPLCICCIVLAVPARMSARCFLSRVFVNKRVSRIKRVNETSLLFMRTRLVHGVVN